MKGEYRKKIDEFVKWYEEKALLCSTSEIGKFFPKIDMRALINKIADYYELKYTDEYLSTDCSSLLESEYTMERLMDSLNWDERFYFYDSVYTPLVHFNSSGFNFELDNNGYVTGGHISGSKEEVLPYVGYHLKEAISYLIEKYPRVNLKEARSAIANYDTQEKIRANIRNCARIEIINRNPGMIGLRRAYLFSVDFGLDVRDILLSARGIDETLFKKKNDVKTLEKK